MSCVKISEGAPLPKKHRRYKKIKRRKQENKKSITPAICSVALAAAIAITPLSVGAAYRSDTVGAEGASLTQRSLGERAKLTYKLPSVSNKSVWAHTRLTTKVNGRTLSEAGLVMNGITYLPLRATATALGLSASYNSATRTMTVTGRGLQLSATDGGFVTYANERPLFAFSPNVIMSSGRMYVPASSLTKAFGLQFSVSGTSLTVTGTYSPLKSASSYYREDEVLWLSRIIMAEAGGESLLGQIAVGDVILNRVRSSAFPNTIWGVIFDRRYGVQFSPVANGTIYNTPSYTSRLAAMICLEGTSLSDNAMYFHNPRTAHAHWIENNRPYAYTIGGHDFYL